MSFKRYQARDILVLPTIFLLTIALSFSGCREQKLAQTAFDNSLFAQKLQYVNLTTKDLHILTALIDLRDKNDLIYRSLQTPFLFPDLFQKKSELLLQENSIASTFSHYLDLLHTDISTLNEDQELKKLSPSQYKTQFVIKEIQRIFRSDIDLQPLKKFLNDAPIELTTSIKYLIINSLSVYQTTQEVFSELSAEERNYLAAHIEDIANFQIGNENVAFENKLLWDLGDKIDLPKLFSVFSIYTRSLEATRDYLLEQNVEELSFPYTVIPTPFGNIIIGSNQPDVHSAAAAILIDLSGNDQYNFETPAYSPRYFPQVLFDLDGNDQYFDQLPSHFASGQQNISVLWDLRGHDLYSAENTSLGAGILGCGLLIDENGDDEYRTNFFGQGAGTFGIGILYDFEGNDNYSGKHYCQGFSMTKGVGLLIDRKGNDFYSAGREYSGWAFSKNSYKSSSQGFSMGIRGVAKGGFAALIDGAGNDAYHGAALSQGAGYWYGIGLLHDLMGEDYYNAVHYSQGAGVHFGVGFLLDNDGNDLYKSVAASMGLGYDQSAGILIDYKVMSIMPKNFQWERLLFPGSGFSMIKKEMTLTK